MRIPGRADKYLRKKTISGLLSSGKYLGRRQIISKRIQHLPCRKPREEARDYEKFSVQPRKFIFEITDLLEKYLTCFDKSTKSAVLPTRPKMQTPPTRNPPLTYCISSRRSMARACSQTPHYRFESGINFFVIRIT